VERQNSEISGLRTALEDVRQEAGQLRQKIAAREEALAKAEAERARHADNVAEELRKKSEDLEEARKVIALLERESSERKAALDDLSKQRDEPAQRFAASEAAVAPQRPAHPPVVKPHIAELPAADFLPVQMEHGIKLQPARPVPVAPPKVRIG
jgi:chromosome segregation ATPase